MIYQVKDNKKIPLGTQFDNSWSIEYDRDLSSLLVGKNTWTATEDCWFQHTILWNKEVYPATVPFECYLNDAVVSTVAISDRMNDLIQITNVLVKKGDVLKLRNKSGGSYAFISNKERTQILHIFPIHRILSKDDGHFDLPHNYDNNSKIVTIDVSQLFKGDAYIPYQITACIGSDEDIFAFSIIAYKIWNGSVYYSTVINRVGVIQAVTNTTITYKIGGSFANVTASAIKL